MTALTGTTVGHPHGPERTLVLWCPDWPVTAARVRAGLPEDVPLALVDRGIVFACSPAARTTGVRRGLAAREAQFRCPELVVLGYDRVLDDRAFEPVIERLEDTTPGVQVLRPGLCAIRSRGPARFYGSEEAAADALVACVVGLGIPGARVGIADGAFAAEQVARDQAPTPVRVVLPGGSAAFLAVRPVTTLVDAGLIDRDLATLLRRLGVHTLRDFAALPADRVRHRFGAAAARAHRIAGAADDGRVVPRVPPRHREVAFDWEPPLDRVDQVTFAIRAGLDAFVGDLAASRLVCTEVTIEVCTEAAAGAGAVHTRSWRHPRWFTGADIADRVRWQLQGAGPGASELEAAITRVRIIPERVDSTADHEQGLWDSGPDERIHHALTRVQGLLGHDGVLTAISAGGRLLRDRRVLVPWGDAVPVVPAQPASARERTATAPWPGSLPGLSPATVFLESPSVLLHATDGAAVGVDERGILSGTPAAFSQTGRTDDLSPVTAWAGPWPLVERWWDLARAHHGHRLQLVDGSGAAWLLLLESARWVAEARYD
ncbi:MULTISPECIES: DNA polymerase Y family protein [unclassified Cryobacterium]|uniref:DNA polymerase Y family protein n=2 Tax=Cryobacterium TaxID=69578 RepID=UPI002AB33D92|nr:MULTISPECIES: DNA polymerase Y family protein [unclassified Cryobacterium]MDY7527796.1 DNA polymerase Y family protein [Cryobacterium sp. 10C2]MEB0200175.1 DNA polymerase Y family protein [Cryobacterium sp. 5I3]MEB0289104.1 DNA polymerase Y family protein [Cryobacterium sp. 10C2]